MSSMVQNLIQNALGDAARSTKFDCIINFVDSSKESLKYLVKTSQFPGKTHEVINIKYKGRTIPIKGQTKYDNNSWTCTFYLTEDHNLKYKFENWIEAIDQKHNIKKVDDNVEYNQMLFDLDNKYTTEMKIIGNDFHGSKNMIEYTLYNCFPKNVSSIDVDYSSTGTVLEFSVEFSYSYFDSKPFNYKPNKIESLKNDIDSRLKTNVKSFKENLGNNISKIFQGFNL